MPASAAEIKLSEEVRSQVERMAQAALAAREAGECYEAEAICRDALRLDPNSAAAHSALSLILQAQGNPAGAAVEMAEAARLDPAIKPRNFWMDDWRRQLAALPKPHPAFIGLGLALTGFLLAFIVVRRSFAPPAAGSGGLTMAATPGNPTLRGAPFSAAPPAAQIGGGSPGPYPYGTYRPGSYPPASYPAAPSNWPGSTSDRAAVDTSALGPGGNWISPSAAFGAGAPTQSRPQSPQDRARTATAAGNPVALPPLVGSRGNPGPLPPATAAGNDGSGVASNHSSGRNVYGSADSFNNNQSNYSSSQPAQGTGYGGSQPSAPGPGYITLSAPNDRPPDVSPPPQPSAPPPDFDRSRSQAQTDYTRGDYEKASLEYKQALRASPSLLETARIRQELGMTYASMGAPREAEQEYVLSQEIYNSMLSGPNAELARQAISTLQKQRQLLEAAR